MTQPSSLLVLQVRAEARAMLFRSGEYRDLEEAVIPLLAYAHIVGLGDKLGGDAVLAVIKGAFGEDWKEAP